MFLLAMICRWIALVIGELQIDCLCTYRHPFENDACDLIEALISMKFVSIMSYNCMEPPRAFYLCVSTLFAFSIWCESNSWLLEEDIWLFKIQVLFCYF